MFVHAQSVFFAYAHTIFTVFRLTMSIHFFVARKLQEIDVLVRECNKIDFGVIFCYIGAIAFGIILTDFCFGVGAFSFYSDVIIKCG